MKSPGDPPDSDLSINRDNRHQYYETAVANASDADREIRQAEARGHQRWVREQERKQTLKRVLVVLVVLAILGCVALAFLK